LETNAPNIHPLPYFAFYPPYYATCRIIILNWMPKGDLYGKPLKSTGYEKMDYITAGIGKL
jgi:hypothetical protein